MTSTTLAFALKTWRAELGWTQEKAAKWLRVSPDTYRGWEGGKRRKKLQRGLIQLRMDQAKARKIA